MFNKKNNFLFIFDSGEIARGNILLKPTEKKLESRIPAYFKEKKQILDCNTFQIAKNKSADDQTARTRRLVCIFDVRMYQSQVFGAEAQMMLKPRFLCIHLVTRLDCMFF